MSLLSRTTKEHSLFSRLYTQKENINPTRLMIPEVADT